MEAPPAGHQAPGGAPVCQVCALDLTTARTFFKVGQPVQAADSRARGSQGREGYTWSRARGGGGGAAPRRPLTRTSGSSPALLPSATPSWHGGAPSVRPGPLQAVTPASPALPRRPPPVLAPQRYRICEEHAAARELTIDGSSQRFCQQ